MLNVNIIQQLIRLDMLNFKLLPLTCGSKSVSAVTCAPMLCEVWPVLSASRSLILSYGKSFHL